MLTTAPVHHLKTLVYQPHYSEKSQEQDTHYTQQSTLVPIA